jgi:hypothetical protein
MRLAVEEHGGGRQFLRYRVSPRWKLRSLELTVLFALLAVLAGGSNVWLAPVVLGGVALAVALRTFYEVAVSVAAFGPLAGQLEQEPTQ